MAETFWSDPQTSPKRVYRWVLSVAGLPTWVVKTAQRPSYQITKTEHNYLSWEFNFPGRVKWQPIEIELVDIVNPDTTRTILRVLRNTGYELPLDPFNRRSISKAQAVAALDGPVLELLDGPGNTIEQWALGNAFLTDFSSDTLSYSEDSLLGMKCTCIYDWATLITPQGAP